MQQSAPQPQRKPLKKPMSTPVGCWLAVACAAAWLIGIIIFFGDRRFDPDTDTGWVMSLTFLPMLIPLIWSLINWTFNTEYKRKLREKEVEDVESLEKVQDALEMLKEAFFVEKELTVSNDEIALGVYKNTAQPITVNDADRQSGIYCLGVQGVGKSSLLEQVIYQDLIRGLSVIVLDPHGDLIDHVIAQMPVERLKDTYLLDIEDGEFPFGLNLFNVPPGATSTQQQQAYDRVLHVFQKCFGDKSEVWLEKYIGNIAPVFAANSQAGYGMADIPRFLRNDAFRNQLVKNTRYFIRDFWENEYASQSPAKRQTETDPLATRINRFVRSPIVGNIIGQAKTTIDFRKAIDSKQILLIRLPIKTLPEDAGLIGAMLVAQIHAAVFSYGDLPLEQRPGFSLFADEFQHFATSDFGEMFIEGHKFGSRVLVAHQSIKQLPPYLIEATNSARTKICFQTTPNDASSMAHMFMRTETTLRKEDIDPRPIEYLLTYGHSNETINTFIKDYLRPVNSMRTGNHILITNWESSMANERYFGKEGRVVGGRMIPLVPSPLPLLNNFFYEVETKKNPNLSIPPDIILGFSNMGNGYYKLFRKISPQKQTYLLSKEMAKLSNLVRVRQELTDEREKGVGILIDVIRQLREVMEILAKNPIGERKPLTPSEVAQEIINLPRRTALVKIGTEIATMRTQDTPSASADFATRKQGIIVRTRKTYCLPAVVVEREIEQRQQSPAPLPPAP